jgi:hypothetical protein
MSIVKDIPAAARAFADPAAPLSLVQDTIELVPAVKEHVHMQLKTIWPHHAEYHVGITPAFELVETQIDPLRISSSPGGEKAVLTPTDEATVTGRIVFIDSQKKIIQPPGEPFATLRFTARHSPEGKLTIIGHVLNSTLPEEGTPIRDLRNSDQPLWKKSQGIEIQDKDTARRPERFKLAYPGRRDVADESIQPLIAEAISAAARITFIKEPRIVQTAKLEC